MAKPYLILSLTSPTSSPKTVGCSSRSDTYYLLLTTYYLLLTTYYSLLTEDGVLQQPLRHFVPEEMSPLDRRTRTRPCLRRSHLLRLLLW